MGWPLCARCLAVSAATKAVGELISFRLRRESAEEIPFDGQLCWWWDATELVWHLFFFSFFDEPWRSLAKNLVGANFSRCPEGHSRRWLEQRSGMGIFTRLIQSSSSFLTVWALKPVSWHFDEWGSSKITGEDRQKNRAGENLCSGIFEEKQHKWRPTKGRPKLVVVLNSQRHVGNSNWRDCSPSFLH